MPNRILVAGDKYQAGLWNVGGNFEAVIRNKQGRFITTHLGTSQFIATEEFYELAEKNGYAMCPESSKREEDKMAERTLNRSERRRLQKQAKRATAIAKEAGASTVSGIPVFKPHGRLVLDPDYPSGKYLYIYDLPDDGEQVVERYKGAAQLAKSNFESWYTMQETMYRPDGPSTSDHKQQTIKQKEANMPKIAPKNSLIEQEEKKKAHPAGETVYTLVVETGESVEPIMAFHDQDQATDMQACMQYAADVTGQGATYAIREILLKD